MYVCVCASVFGLAMRVQTNAGFDDNTTTAAAAAGADRSLTPAWLALDVNKGNYLHELCSRDCACACVNVFGELN